MHRQYNDAKEGMQMNSQNGNLGYISQVGRRRFFEDYLQDLIRKA